MTRFYARKHVIGHCRRSRPLLTTSNFYPQLRLLQQQPPPSDIPSSTKLLFGAHTRLIYLIAQYIEIFFNREFVQAPAVDGYSLLTGFSTTDTRFHHRVSSPESDQHCVFLKQIAINIRKPHSSTYCHRLRALPG